MKLITTHNLFYSKMKNKCISDEEYNICAKAWKDNNMKTFKDFLEWCFTTWISTQIFNEGNGK